MFRTINSSKRDRRAVILMIVVTLLTLFAVVGIAFVLYSESSASGMRMWKEGQAGGHTTVIAPTARGNPFEEPPIPQDIFNKVLGDLIYDVPDDARGVHNALRGHSLARAMLSAFNSNGTIIGSPSPYIGVGRPNFPNDPATPVVNYTFVPGQGVYDPERYGNGARRTNLTQPLGGTHIAKNAPYTYPDMNNFYLGAIRATDGKVLVPSFHRQQNLVNQPGLPWYSNPNNRLRMLRPLSGAGTPNPNFPAPLQNPDGSWGDVENLEGKLQAAQQRYDSFWIDPDLPVRMWQGKLYKPLVAMLIVDLDGRVNVNTASNISGPNQVHTSNQGLGRWEVDLKNVLEPGSAFNSPPPGQAANILRQPAGRGRFGTPGPQGFVPEPAFTPVTGMGATTPFSAPAILRIPFYAALDYDGSAQTNPGGQPQMQLPGAGGNSPISTAPLFPQRYQSASTIGERQNHPLLQNPYFSQNTANPAGSNSPTRDRVFNPYDMFLLNHKFNTDDANYQRSELGQIVTSLRSSVYPGTGQFPANTQNPRFLVTSISNDYNIASLSPWVHGGYNYQLATNNNVQAALTPTGQNAAHNFPNTPNINTTAQQSEYSANTWWNFLSGWGTFRGHPTDLNRPLRSYTPGNAAANQGALDDRRLLARDIFHNLIAATGAGAPPAGNQITAPPPGPRYDAYRWLAQLAVNIVDYIDNDDVMTVYQWNPQNNQEFVVGTENPRLVVNEAYVRIENDPNDPGPNLPPQANGQPQARATLPFVAKAWVELHNPITPPDNAAAATLYNNGTAQMGTPAQSFYRMLITTVPPQQLDRVTNVTGDPTIGLNPNDVRLVNLGSVPAAFRNVPPNLGAQYNNNSGSFILVGAEQVPGGGGPAVTQVFNTMSWRIPLNEVNNPRKPTFVLQRLADPNQQPGQFNPWVTIDYTQFTVNAQMNWAIRFDGNGQAQGNQRPNLQNERAWGRVQPLTARSSQAANQFTFLRAMNINPPPPGGASFHHTFYRANGQGNNVGAAGGTLLQPFEWLTHLDRQLISPPELFCVSVCKPHELTQRFMLPNGPNQILRHQHLANWVDDNNRLFRFLAFATTRDRTLGTPSSGRIPGKVNINTIWDSQVLQAVCDANAVNRFTQNDINNLWNQWRQSRDGPDLLPGTGNERPFMSIGSPITANGLHPGGNSFRDTILRPGGVAAAVNPAIDTPGQTHPYLKNELLTKVFNQFTTRSNVFAVWCTVGYFEVTNTGPFSETNRPALGAELNADQGKSVRHKFFAIVDRTNISQGSNPNTNKQPPRTIEFSLESDDVMNTGNNNNVRMRVPAAGMTSVNGQNVLYGNYDGTRWTIGQGTRFCVNHFWYTATVTQPPVFLGPNQGGEIVLNGVSFEPRRGCLMRCLPDFGGGGLGDNTQFYPGTGFHPGPQQNFSSTSDNYKDLVPVSVQIN